MKDQKEVVKKVIDYIEKNLEKEINLDNISKNIGYSKFYLNRIFTTSFWSFIISSLRSYLL